MPPAGPAKRVAGRAAQLKATMESAEGTLKMAAQSLDVQAAGFRAATTAAAEAPLEAARSSGSASRADRRGFRRRHGPGRIRAGAAGKASQPDERCWRNG